MRVIVNCLSTLKPKTGVGHYADQLTAALRRLHPPNAITRFPGDAVATLCRRPPVGRAIAPGRARRGAALVKGLGRQAIDLAFRARCRVGRFDLYHEPNFLPMPASVPVIVTVHDLSVLLYPQWHPADRVRRHESYFRTAVARAAHVITVSHAVRRQVIETLGVPPARVTVVYNGISPEFFQVTAGEIAAVRHRNRLPENYLLFVGTIEPRKNLLTVLRAYCDLPAAVRERCPLVLAGGWGWRAGDTAEFIATTASHRNVIHLGYVPDADRPGLYAAARALVSPSHYEGFGLPPLEMLATGGAVIAANIDAHAEILGGNAHLIAPDDQAAWRGTLLRAIDDPDWPRLVRGRAEHAADFTWERCAHATTKVYRTVLGIRQAA
jgi:alpha-1,3-rhamnosyl/mannosyltransferase